MSTVWIPCSVCGGDGSDLEDSSKKCYECGGLGKVQLVVPDLKPLNDTAAVTRLQDERDEARAAVARVTALLPKWGQNIERLRGEGQDVAANCYEFCWGDLSAALHVPEPATEYAAHVAEHAEEERLQRMADAGRMASVDLEAENTWERRYGAD